MQRGGIRRGAKQPNSPKFRGEFRESLGTSHPEHRPNNYEHRPRPQTSPASGSLQGINSGVFKRGLSC